MGSVPDYFYSQSAVIPFGWRDDVLEVLMISSRKRKRWVIPKGVKEPGLSARESAAKEALEEAGILGTVSTQPLGRYHYQKWGGSCEVQVFAMRVDKMLTEWQESYRDREWVLLDEARERVQEKRLKAILESLPEQIETLTFQAISNPSPD